MMPVLFFACEYGERVWSCEGNGNAVIGDGETWLW